jgi:hypothetical protein
MGTHKDWRSSTFRNTELETLLDLNLTPKQLDFVDEVFALCEKNYLSGGDMVLDKMSVEGVAENFENLAQVKAYCSRHRTLGSLPWED